MKAMLLAAGLGTRLKPFTDKHPKALALVNGKTLLQRNIGYLHQFGVSELIINLHHFGNQIQDFIQQHHFQGIRIVFSDEKDEVLETGGGLKKASWFFDDGQPFVLMNADILTDLDLGSMLEYHSSRKPLATLAVSGRESSRCFLINANTQLCGWKNRTTGETRLSIPEKILCEVSFSGIHIIEPRLFSLMHQEGKFSMIDVYLSLAKTERILTFDHSGSKLLDVGKPESIALAEKWFR